MYLLSYECVCLGGGVMIFFFLLETGPRMALNSDPHSLVNAGPTGVC